MGLNTNYKTIHLLLIDNIFKYLFKQLIIDIMWPYERQECKPPSPKYDCVLILNLNNLKILFYKIFRIKHLNFYEKTVVYRENSGSLFYKKY